MLRAENIHKSFDTLEVLKGIDLQIGRSEIVAIVGPSGAGKTTLLQILGTLDRPTSGSILYTPTPAEASAPTATKPPKAKYSQENGQTTTVPGVFPPGSPTEAIDLSKLNDRQLAAFRNRNIGFVFQFHQLLPEFSLLENVALPALIGGQSRKQAEQRAMQLIDYLNLSERTNHRPAQLSGGERQRAAVARALVNSPALVLADEPSGSLDTANRNELHRLFFDIRRDLGTTFVIVTHDENFAADADRIITIRDGRLT